MHVIANLLENTTEVYSSFFGWRHDAREHECIQIKQKCYNSWDSFDKTPLS